MMNKTAKNYSLLYRLFYVLLSDYHYHLKYMRHPASQKNKLIHLLIMFRAKQKKSVILSRS